MSETVCLVNLGRRGVRLRVVMGFAGLAASLGLLVLLISFGASRLWRAGLFLPLWTAAAGTLQAREKT